MKNRIIVLPILLSVPFVALAFDSVHKNLSLFLENGYTPFIYNLMFGFAFVWIIVCGYFKHKSVIDTQIRWLGQYLNRHSNIAIIYSGIFVGVPLGFVSRIVWIVMRYDNAKIYVGVIFSLVTVFMVLLVWRYFREKVLLSFMCIKLTGLIVISSLCANLLFLFLCYIEVIHIPRLPWSEIISYDAIFEGGVQPISCIIEMWKWRLIWIGAVPFSLLLSLIAYSYRWLKGKIKQQAKLQELN